MSREISRASTVVFAALLAFAFAASRADAQVAVGQPVKLAMKTIDGKALSSDSLKGKVVLLDFWATWCGPCMAEVPHMKQIHDTYGKRGLTMIGISLDRSVDAMKPVIQQQGMSWTHVHDATKQLSQQFGVNGIPNVFLISPDGVVRWNGHPANIDKALADVFAKFPPVLVDAKAVKAAEATRAEAEQKLAAGDGVGAVKLMAKVPEGATSDPEFGKAAEETRGKLVAAGQEMIKAADADIAAGKFADAAGRLRDVSLALAGTPAGDDAKQRLDAVAARPEAKKAIESAKLDAQASPALDAAKKLRAAKQHEAAYPKLKQVAESYPGTASADEAAKLVKQYESDAAFMKRLKDKESGGKAKSALNLARSYAKAGSKEQAKKKFEQVIKDYPGTEHARAAEAELASFK